MVARRSVIKRKYGAKISAHRIGVSILVAAVTVLMAQSAVHFDGARALQYAREIVAFGPRYNGSQALTNVQAYLRKQFAKDDLTEDTFVVDTPAGPQALHNFIVKFPGKKDGIIVLATHYETPASLARTMAHRPPDC
jgi:glutaminyl-peptide cyclotransferase